MLPKTAKDTKDSQSRLDFFLMKSPQFKEQKKYSAPKPSAEDAPSRLSNKNKKQRGGQREKAHKAHLIVSSAFVPTPVLNHMQESHHQASTSCIEEVPVELTPAPGFTMVGGPSHAPIRSVAPVQVASFKPTGISYAKVHHYLCSPRQGRALNKLPSTWIRSVSF